MAVGKSYIIAEAGVNHNGNLDEAKKLIKAAAKTGADAVKFQTFIVEKNYNKKSTDQEKLKWAQNLEITSEELFEIIDCCKKYNITFLSTPFDIPSAELLYERGMSLYKIASSELCNFRLLRCVAEKGLPIYLSVGMATSDEIKLALQVINESWKGKGTADVTLLYCVSLYPAPYDCHDLRQIAHIRDTYGVPSGFSDHSLGIELPIASAALGAVVIEKHFKLSPDHDCPDAPVSLDPAEFKKMVQAIRNVESAIGIGEFKLSKAEEKSRDLLRKGLYATTGLAKSSIITEEDIIFEKPAGGIGIENYFNLVGQKLVKDIQSGEIFTHEHIG
ncbi:MAG: N-acetylneuraminate synthase [SAR324 cluster bacterium]|uniref:N-acetylneuraminate synthase n=1 Tax=SAR324 cluster bacterium TaxID=2024889 RepID=A0A2A4T0X1_9DELT|nr:MAG: N-acetylneuraminate synthase [SAR324 cluster bacterium]